jgi:hypothetical protein
MEKVKIVVHPTLVIEIDGQGPQPVPHRRPRPRPAYAMTVDGREEVVEYPTCRPWTGPL